MKWCFLLGSPDISGGTYVIFEHATRVQKSGIDVVIVTHEKVKISSVFWHSDAKNLTFKTYEEVKNEIFDVVFATWWKTVFELYRIKAKKYAYFVQSIESKFYNDKELPLINLVNSTYNLPLYFITEAKWIQKYLNDYHNKDAQLVPNGLRKDIYCLDGECIAPRETGKLRVLVEGPVDVHFKNVDKTIKICQKSNADEIWLLTSSPIKSYKGIDKVFSRVPINETPKIYRSCDVIVKLSYVEGMFGPPLELFHCGGTSITYDVTGHDEYIIANHNGFVACVDDDDMVLKYINTLKNDVKLLEEMKKNATITADNWPDWQVSSDLFMKATKNILDNKTEQDITDIKILAENYFKWYEIAEFYKLGGKKTGTFIKKMKQIFNNKFPRYYIWLRRTRAKFDNR